MKSIHPRSTCLSLALVFAASIIGYAEKQPPNVLFIAVDDLRPELGVYGADHIISPNIDALADESLTFTRAYCQQAVCNPSRASIMTGLRPDTTEVYDLKTHFRDTVPDVYTIPEYFKAHGYATKGMGKIYHGHLHDDQSWSDGYTSFGGWPPYVRPENIALFNHLRREHRDSGKPGWGVIGPAVEMADLPDSEYAGAEMTDYAIEMLEAYKAEGTPFFLAVGYVKPHLPFVAPKRYWDLYDRESIELPENYLESPPAGLPNEFRNSWSGEMGMYQVPEVTYRHGTRIFPEDFAKELIHGYYACVSFIDAQIGRLMDALDELGLHDNTIIILWGDHGFHLGDHGTWTKHTNFEIATHVPLIFSHPGMAAKGQKTDALVEFVDVFPSLADAAGLDIPDQVEGISFVPLTDDPDLPWKSAAFSQYPFTRNGIRYMGYSIRTDRYRYTEYQRCDGSGQVDYRELYDHESDPQENTNLAPDPAYAELVDQLSQQLNAGWVAAQARAER